MKLPGFSTFWSSPWGYPQATLVSSGFLINGWLIQLVAGDEPLRAPAFPFNAIALALLVLALFVAAWKWRHNPLVKWLGGVPMSIASLAHLGLLSLIAGVVPQGEGGWAANVITSWSFALLLFLVLTNLGLAIFLRFFQRRGWRDWGFVTNHMGIWVVLAAMAAGAGDLSKVRVVAREGVRTTSGHSKDDQTLVEFPFGLLLHDFKIDEYPPKLAFFTPKSTRPEYSPVVAPKAGERLRFSNLEAEVLAVLSHAEFDGTTYVAAAAGAPAWKLRVVEEGKPPQEGWVSPGKGETPAKALHTNAGVIALMDPEAKHYRSTVALTDGAGANERMVTIEVNRPLSVAGWKIFQASFEPDEQTGEIRASILEAVRDPWLPVVYLGAFLMLAGSAFLFFNGLQRKETA